MQSSSNKIYIILQKAPNKFYFGVNQCFVSVTFDIHFQPDTIIKESNPLNLKFKITCAAAD